MPDPTIPVRDRDQLDWAALEQHLRTALDLPPDRMEVAQFPGGHANLTYLLSFGTAKLVLRRPPHGALAPGSHDMAREHRVLSRLWEAFPPAPRAFHFCDDTSVVGAPFVVVQYREGEVVRDSIPPAMVGHPDVVRRVDLALVDAAADLHTVDAAGVGLETLGRPDGFGERQVHGWWDRWRRATPDDAFPAMHEVAERLAVSVPAPRRVSVVHNDLKLDNCQFRADDPDTVVSVFDWDMATLGDPLFDLAAILTAMGSSPVWAITDDEAVTRYSARSGIDVSGIDWYRAFATWRTAIVIQQLHNRYASGATDDERLARMADHIPGIAERARDLVR